MKRDLRNINWMKTIKNLSSCNKKIAQELWLENKQCIFNLPMDLRKNPKGIFLKCSKLNKGKLH